MHRGLKCDNFCGMAVKIGMGKDQEWKRIDKIVVEEDVTVVNVSGVEEGQGGLGKECGVCSCHVCSVKVIATLQRAGDS